MGLRSGLGGVSRECGKEVHFALPFLDLILRFDRMMLEALLVYFWRRFNCFKVAPEALRTD